MDPVREQLAREVERRWGEYDAHPTGPWPLVRRDGAVREILDGNVQAFEARRRGSDTIEQAQQAIVDSIQAMELATRGHLAVVDFILEQGRRRLAARGEIGRPIRFLEAASGAGWLMRHLWERARARGIAVELCASDYNEALVHSLRERLHDQGVPAEARLADARHMPDVPDGAWDVGFMTYTLHHLPPPDAALCLRELDRVSGGGLVLVDLLRARFSLLAIPLVTATIGRAGGAYALHDGLASVRRAYTARELRSMLEWVGLGGRYRVGPLPTWNPQRLLSVAIFPAQD